MTHRFTYCVYGNLAAHKQYTLNRELSNLGSVIKKEYKIN